MYKMRRLETQRQNRMVDNTMHQKRMTAKADAYTKKRYTTDFIVPSKRLIRRCVARVKNEIKDKQLNPFDLLLHIKNICSKQRVDSITMLVVCVSRQIIDDTYKSAVMRKLVDSHLDSIVPITVPSRVEIGLCVNNVVAKIDSQQLTPTELLMHVNAECCTKKVDDMIMLVVCVGRQIIADMYDDVATRKLTYSYLDVNAPIIVKQTQERDECCCIIG